MAKLVTCIVNAKAGSHNGEAKSLIERVAAEHGWKAKVVTPANGADITALARQARAEGEMVAGGGGDGTLSAVASALVDTDTVLGVLPMGTLNHFAKDMGVPLELESAARTLFTGKVVRVDVGEVNGRVFLNNSSIGFYPRIVQAREREQRQGSSKGLALARATALVFRKSQTLHVELEDNESRHQAYDTPFVFVGNNRYTLAGLKIGTRETLTNGRLWVCAAPDTGRFGLLGLALGAVAGIVGDADLVAFETQRTEMRMHRDRTHVATDGEITLMQTPLRYRTRPGALRVVAPAET